MYGAEHCVQLVALVQLTQPVINEEPMHLCMKKYIFQPNHLQSGQPLSGDVYAGVRQVAQFVLALKPTVQREHDRVPVVDPSLLEQVRQLGSDSVPEQIPINQLTQQLKR